MASDWTGGGGGFPPVWVKSNGATYNVRGSKRALCTTSETRPQALRLQPVCSLPVSSRKDGAVRGGCSRRLSRRAARRLAGARKESHPIAAGRRRIKLDVVRSWGRH